EGGQESGRGGGRGGAQPEPQEELVRHERKDDDGAEGSDIAKDGGCILVREVVSAEEGNGIDHGEYSCAFTGEKGKREQARGGDESKAPAEIEKPYRGHDQCVGEWLGEVTL